MTEKDSRQNNGRLGAHVVGQGVNGVPGNPSSPGTPLTPCPTTCAPKRPLFWRESFSVIQGRRLYARRRAQSERWALETERLSLCPSIHAASGPGKHREHKAPVRSPAARYCTRLACRSYRCVKGGVKVSHR